MCRAFVTSYPAWYGGYLWPSPGLSQVVNWRTGQRGQEGLCSLSRRSPWRKWLWLFYLRGFEDKGSLGQREDSSECM